MRQAIELVVVCFVSAALALLVSAAVCGCGGRARPWPDVDELDAGADAVAAEEPSSEAAPFDAGLRTDYDADGACEPFRPPDGPRTCALALPDAGIYCDRMLLECEPEAYPTSLSCVRFQCSAFWCCDPS